MATLTEIEQAITHATRYQNTDSSVHARNAVKFAHDIIALVRECLKAPDSAAELTRPDDVRGVGKPVGDCLISYDDGYFTGVRVFASQHAAVVHLHIIGRKADGLNPEQHKRWTVRVLNVPFSKDGVLSGQDFDLGNDFIVTDRDALARAITDAAKVALVEKAKQPLARSAPRGRRDDGGN
jgi:hypothetical protein